MAETLSELVVKITADAKELKHALADSEKAVLETGKVIDKETKSIALSVKDVGKAFAVMGAAITGIGVLSVKSFTDTGQALGRMSDQTGISVQALSKLSYAAEVTGTNFGAIATASRSMSNTLADAVKWNKEVASGLVKIGAEAPPAVQALTNIGLSASNLMLLNPEQRFMAIATAIAGIADPTLKSAAATDLFGRAALELMPMLNDLPALMANAAKYARIFTDEDVRKANEFGAALVNLKSSVSQLGDAIAQNLMPVVQPLIEQITGVVKGFGEWAKANPDTSQGLVEITAAIGILMVALAPLLLTLPGLVIAFKGLAGTIGILITALSGLALIPFVALAAGITMVGIGLGQLADSGLKNAQATSLNSQATEEYNKLLLGEENAYSKVLAEQIKLAESYKGLNAEGQIWLEQARERLSLLTAEEAIRAALNKQNAEALNLVKQMNEGIQKAFRGGGGGAGGGANQLSYDEWLKTESGQAALKAGNPVVAYHEALAGGYATKSGYREKTLSEKFQEYYTVAGQWLQTMRDQTGNQALTLDEAIAKFGVPSGPWYPAQPVDEYGAYDPPKPGDPDYRPGGGYLELASGGIVTQPTMAMLGEQAPRIKEAVIPETDWDKLGGAGGGNVTIQFTQPVFFDREDTMNKFVDMIRKGIQRQDRLRFGGAYSG